MAELLHSTTYSHVTINVDPEKSPELIRAAVEMGVQRVFTVKGRGVLRKKKWGPFEVPGISPLLDVLHLMVPQSHVMAVLERLVEVGDLDRFGAGSIYASHTHDLWYRNTVPFESSDKAPQAMGTVEFETNLVAVSCIAQLEHAEEIAHAAMLEGSPSPTIYYGYGHGIRDRLGFFLQLTINPKKEFIELVVSEEEVERVFEVMVEEGHLDEPAQGFISTRPVDIGLVNTMSFQHTSPYPATMEQIIKAIDQLQGNTNWRRSAASKSPLSRRKKLENLVNLNCVVPRGFGDVCSMAAMEAGASGTSTTFANATPKETAHTHLDGSDEREIISLSVKPALVQNVVDAVLSVPELASTPIMIYASPAPLAVTYLP